MNENLLHATSVRVLVEIVLSRFVCGCCGFTWYVDNTPIRSKKAE